MAYSPDLTRSTMPTGDPPLNFRFDLTNATNYTNAQLYYNNGWNPSQIFMKQEGTAIEGFDPAKVDWRELMVLYQDDPLLMAIFDGIKEYFAETSDLSLNPVTPSVAVGSSQGYNTALSSVTTTAGTFLTNGNSFISPTFTLTQDASGDPQLKADGSGIVNTEVTWGGITDGDE